MNEGVFSPRCELGIWVLTHIWPDVLVSTVYEILRGRNSYSTFKHYNADSSFPGSCCFSIKGESTKAENVSETEKGITLFTLLL